MPASVQRSSIGDICTQFHLACVIGALHQIGVFREMNCGRGLCEAATACGASSDLVVAAMQLLERHTDIVEFDGVSYRLSGSYSRASPWIDQYILAFGPAAVGFADTLTSDPAASIPFDHKAMACAQSETSLAANETIVAFLHRCGFTNVFEIGCGVGGLGVELAKRNSRLVYQGVDNNPFAIQRAIELAAGNGVESNCSFRFLDCRHVDMLSDLDLSGVECVVTSQFLNGLCYPGHDMLVAWLRELRDLLPGRALVVADYCSAALPSTTGLDFSRLATQNLVQLISKQGIPPATHTDWLTVFHDAGCTPYSHIAVCGDQLFVDALLL